MKLSIIIVNYNTKLLTKQAIDSARSSIDADNIDAEIILMDNSSNPNEMLEMDTPNIRIFRIENKGFGNACNAGAKYAQGEYLLFLNSDTLLQFHTLGVALGCIQKNGNIGALGIHTVLADGTLDYGCKRGFPTPFNSLCYFLKLDRLRYPRFCGYHLLYLDEHTSHYVDCVSGAFLMIPQKLFNSISGFDEDFFMYGEDIDICYRIKESGYDVLYCADTMMTHLKGLSGLQSKNKNSLKAFYDSMIIFYDKHYKAVYGRPVTWMVHLLIKIKYYLSICTKK